MPDRSPKPPSPELVARMQRLAAFIVANAERSLPLAVLAKEAAMSAHHFQRVFTAVLGVSPRQYQAAQRLQQFKTRLRDGEAVLTATYEAGYGSTSRVYEQVTGGLGMTPSAYRAGGAGESITYAVRTTAFGQLLMAATARGVCLVEFGDDGDLLVARLHDEFPRATLVPASESAREPLDAWMDALDAHVVQGAPRPELPLDLRGTAFQIKVWRFLLSVKPGRVVSYGELAAAIGHPDAVRAVGSACGANRIAVLIPCHRALRADGSLGGYRWGLERKRVLLDNEKRGG
ncbi:bifunctional transcriptional activator/DNA repair enzyme AdaA [Gemmatimonas phototrophica]|uniref:methylated-DNA--[protein]-cysteine S-methyltransferase n=1 Tax=Gemmatimonas phototrophica TaxID=1379270 RepID=A0A143BHF4_9BACT|nr:methylated-DNA--[protein]-cysteine S-methyltransferase [Gemmatimonas phototrophica]AMW03890.1 cysteine methyltransferase [Gemmatimonas phototrophica]